MDKAAERALSQPQRGGDMLVAAALDRRLKQCFTLKVGQRR
jgi:hypothetical protein